MGRKLSKEEFVLRATLDLAEKKRKAERHEYGIYRAYIRERQTAYYREQRNRGVGLKGAALQ